MGHEHAQWTDSEENSQQASIQPDTNLPPLTVYVKTAISQLPITTQPESLTNTPRVRDRSLTKCVWHLTIVSVTRQVVHHDDCPTRMITNHCPEVDDSVWQRHLSHDERISLLVALQQSPQDAVGGINSPTEPEIHYVITKRL